MASSNCSRLFSVRCQGAANTNEYRVFCVKDSDSLPVSLFHDVPLSDPEDPPNVFNMVVEIPRWTNAKLEISKEEPLNPIKQDIKKGALRFVANVFPNHGYLWNYGAIPQTWEDPRHICPDTGCRGDNDPIDVCEIGSAVPAKPAMIKKVKVLGVLAMMDEGETDWKVIAIDCKDPLSTKLNNIKDVDSLMPGLLDATREWFRNYKIPDGKPANAFAFDGAYKDADYAIAIIKNTHVAWKELMAAPKDNKDVAKISRVNTTLDNAHSVDATSSIVVAVLKACSNEPPAKINDSVGNFFFLPKL